MPNVPSWYRPTAKSVSPGTQSSKVSIPAGGTPSWYRPSGATKQVADKGKFLSGNAFMDVLDWLSMPQYAITGLLSGKGIMEGIKTRYTPAEAMGLSGAKGLVADILLDPLWLLTGPGGLTKKGIGMLAGKASKKVLQAEKLWKTAIVTKDAKAIAKASKALAAAKKTGEGKTLATTLGGRALKGEAAAITLDVPFVKSLQGIPLVPKKVSEVALGGITKGAELLKRIPLPGGKNVGGVMRGVFGTLPAAPSGSTIEGIEEYSKKFFTADELAKSAKRVQSIIYSDALTRMRPMYNKVDKWLKKGVLKGDDIVNVYNKLDDPIKYAAKKLSKEAKEYHDFLKPLIKEADKEWSKYGGAILGGKGLPNLLKEELLKDMKSKIDLVAQAKVIGGKIGQREFAQYHGLKDATGKIIDYVRGTISKSKSISGGTAYEKIGDNLYIKTTDKGIIDNLTQRVKGLEGIRKGIYQDLNKFNLKKTLTRKEFAKRASLKKELDRVFKTIEGAKGKIESIKSTKAFQRTGVGAMELNKAFTKAGLKPIFELDPMKSVMAKLTSAGKLKAEKEFLASATEKFGKVIKDGIVPEGWTKLKGVKGMSDVVFEKDIAEILGATYSKFSQIESINDFAKAWDTMQNYWKKTATYWNVAFHTRNFVSNAWQLFLADSFNPIAAVRDMKIMKKIKAANRKGIGFKGMEKVLGKEEYEKFFLPFVMENLGGTGQFFGDIEQALKKRSFLTEAGGALGNWIEDSSKYTLFKNRIGKGFSTEAAARDVRKYLFDYTDLTDFEKNVFKRIFPFYAWTRKNLPLQVATLIQDPRKIAVLPKMKRAIEEMSTGEPMDESLLPEWMRNGYSVFLGENPGGMKEYFNLQGFLPTVDLSTWLNQPATEVLSQITPFVKTPIELLANYDFYYKNQIKQFEGQREQVLGISGAVPPGLRKTLDMFRPLREVESLFGLKAMGEGKQPGTVKNRLMKLLGGINVKEFNEKKQKEVLDMLIDMEVSKVKKEKKTARKAGQERETDRLSELLRKLKTGEIKPSL